jgi:hypothetical protein
MLSRLEQLPEAKTTDIDVRVVDAYKLQCIAEAQEGIMFRAHTHTWIFLGGTGYAPPPQDCNVQSTYFT